LEVPAGALGNQREMQLLPEQNVMVESDTAEDMFGDPFVMLPAAALNGYRGITRVKPHREIVVYTLHFEQEQVVFACSGALFHCPSDTLGSLLDMDQATAAYAALPIKDANELVAYMEIENSAVATSQAPQYDAAA